MADEFDLLETDSTEVKQENQVDWGKAVDQM